MLSIAYTAHHSSPHIDINRTERQVNRSTRSARVHCCPQPIKNRAKITNRPHAQRSKTSGKLPALFKRMYGLLEQMCFAEESKSSLATASNIHCVVLPVRSHAQPPPKTPPNFCHVQQILQQGLWRTRAKRSMPVRRSTGSPVSVQRLALFDSNPASFQQPLSTHNPAVDR